MKKQKNAPHVLPRKEWPYEVPENWVWTQFGALALDMADGPFGSNLKREHYTKKQEARIIQLSNIGEDGWREENKKYTTFSHAREISRSIVAPGDIVIAKMMPAGRAIICPNDEEMYILSSDAVKMTPLKTLIVKYLLYSINSPFFRNQIQENTQGITRARTSIKKLKQYPFPLAPLPEQHRIVSRIESLFAKLDTAAEKIRAALDQFPTRKAAILHKAFTGELTKKWRKENGVGMESWEETTLKDETLQIGDGLHGTPNFDKLGKYYFVNGNNLNDDCIQIKNDTKRINEIEYEKYKVELSSNTVLLSINGTLGKTAFYRKEPIILGKSACYINVSKKLNKNFLRYYFNTWFFRDYANEKATGSTIKNLGLKAIREMPLYLPTFSEQKEIVRILDAIFEREQAAKETAERLLEQIALTKKSILARAFRGLLGTNDPKEESAERWLKGTIMEI